MIVAPAPPCAGPRLNRPAVSAMIKRVVAAPSRGGREAEQGGSLRSAGPSFCRPQAAGVAPRRRSCLFAEEEAMLTNRTVTGAAMLFAAVILAHPGSGFASSHAW